MASAKRKQLLQDMFSAHWALARAMLATRGSFAQDCGLNRGQAEALFAVHFRGCRTIGQLAATMGVTSGAATQTVEGLETSGLVKRRRQEDDRRVVHIDFTDQGKKLLNRLTEYQFQRMEQLMAGLSDDDIRELTRIELQIMATLKSQAEKVS